MNKKMPDTTADKVDSAGKTKRTDFGRGEET